MEELNVVWHEGADSLDNRSRYGIATLLNETFDGTRGFEFVHRNTMSQLPSSATEAIVVIHGEHELPHYRTIESDVSRLQRALIINIGDEAAQYPLSRLHAPNRKIWLQMPVPGRYSFVRRFLICGYPHDAKMRLAHYNAESVDRPYDWSFSGQVQHWRRQECVSVLSHMPNGFLKTTSGFWQGLDRAEYYKLLADTKLSICPGGTCTPDTMRMAEALEAGCLPIVDGSYADRSRPEGYWEYVLGTEPPFPVVTNWRDLPTIMKNELSKWPHNRDAAISWWKEYKHGMYRWISEDIHECRKRA